MLKIAKKGEDTFEILSMNFGEVKSKRFLNRLTKRGYIMAQGMLMRKIEDGDWEEICEDVVTVEK